MRLPFLRPKDPAPDRARSAAPPPGSELTLEAARARARHRLVGALVLLLLGIIGFPLLFETQPRPLPLDTPIAVSGEVLTGVKPVTAEQLPPPAGPAAQSAAAQGVEPPPPAPTAAAAVAAAVQPASPAPAPVAAVTRPASAVASSPAPAPPRASGPTPPPVSAAAPPRPAAEPARTSSTAAAGADASMTAASVPAAPRFVVQAGAYADAASLRSARQRVEKLGLKTYTQIIESAGGIRTRVRVGPFDSRDEAQAVAERIRAAGLQAAVLSL